MSLIQKRRSEMKRLLVYFFVSLAIAVAVIMMMVFFSSFGSGYHKASNEADRVVIHDVVRIFMHERGHYTFFCREKGQSAIRIYTFMCNVDKESGEKIVEDVPPDRACWVETSNPDPEIGERFRRKLVIHLHSVREVNGAGWDHGKFGYGQTTVLE